MPDICRLLVKYSLDELLNNYISSQVLPSKYEWKKTVKSKISEIEHTLWRNRLNETDFTRFKVLQTSITSAAIWLNINDRYDLKKRRQLADLWIKIPNTDIENVCSLCEQISRDKLRHILADCPCTESSRQSFISDICDNFNKVTFDSVFNLSSEVFIQLALGAGTVIDLTDDAEHSSLLTMAVDFVIQWFTYYDSEIALGS